MRRDWTDNEMILTLALYFKLPYHRLNRNTPEVIELATLIGRTNNSVAIRLVNYAACDPSLTSQGKVGMYAGIHKCQPYWDKYANNKEELFWKEANIKSAIIKEPIEAILSIPQQDFSGKEREAIIKQRINQDAFRSIILANYNQTCAISGITVPQLLIASHIIPWSDNEIERLNPENGICLSALYDKAFDSGLISIDPDDYSVIISKELKDYKSAIFYNNHFAQIEHKPIITPERHSPNKLFLEYHMNNIFSKHN